MKANLRNSVDAGQLEEVYGPLSVKMLTDTPLVQIWRIMFVANFYSGATSKDFEQSFDLSRLEFVILFCLSHKPGLTAKEVCAVTGYPKNSISRAVHDLLDKKLIDREARVSDRRNKSLTMTAQGKRLLKSVIPIFEKRQSDMLAFLSEKEQRQLEVLMSKLAFGASMWASTD
jgi:DNA-binding MarR family transcriptional regulator